MDEDKSRITVRETESDMKYCCTGSYQKKCMGAACMAWRWVMKVPDGEIEYKQTGPHCPSMKTQRSEYGYCGMVK